MNHRIAASCLALLLAGAGLAGATNGLYLTAYGAEVMGRAGANIAISDRTLGLNSNPAGIAQLQGDHYTLSLALLAPSLEFENMVNGPTESEDRYFPLPAFAWVRAGKETFLAEIEQAGFEFAREVEVEGFSENYLLEFRVPGAPR